MNSLQNFLKLFIKCSVSDKQLLVVSDVELICCQNFPCNELLYNLKYRCCIYILALKNARKRNKLETFLITIVVGRYE